MTLPDELRRQGRADAAVSLFINRQLSHRSIPQICEIVGITQADYELAVQRHRQRSSLARHLAVLHDNDDGAA